MKLALNTYVYAVAQDHIMKALRSAVHFGFTHVEYAACDSGDPTVISARERGDIVSFFQDNGLHSSQLLLIHTQHCATSDPQLRRQALDYMKACGEFQLELGGRQVLVCWGCGVHEADMLPEQAWLNTVSLLREYAEWGLDRGILIDLEIEPHVYFLLNSTSKAALIVEDVGMPNVFPNLDIGHFVINREAPNRIEKIKDKIIHVHLSETEGFDHTNSILGTGCVDFKAYVDKAVELGIEENCARVGEPCVAGIEMGEPGGEVDDADRWVQESLDYLAHMLPDLTR
jgi:sugar phosphate isomerase/epimerase